MSYDRSHRYNNGSNNNLLYFSKGWKSTKILKVGRYVKIGYSELEKRLNPGLKSTRESNICPKKTFLRVSRPA